MCFGALRCIHGQHWYASVCVQNQSQSLDQFIFPVIVSPKTTKSNEKQLISAMNIFAETHRLKWWESFFEHVNRSQIIEIVISNWCDCKSIDCVRCVCVRWLFRFVFQQILESHVEYAVLRLVSFCLHTSFVHWLSLLFSFLPLSLRCRFFVRWRKCFHMNGWMNECHKHNRKMGEKETFNQF